MSTLKLPSVSAVHDRNDETLERIYIGYIGRCFKNHTQRLGKLFEVYSRITKKVKS